MFVLEELGLLEVFSLKNSELDEYFTTDPAVIRYRLEVFKDMLKCPEISKTLNKLIPILTDIMELRRLEADSGDTSSYLESITEIELYISCVETLFEGLSTIKGELHSASFIALADYITELATSDYHRELNAKLEELTNRVREIKSVTIGVNLDSQLRPASAGVLSINSQEFRSGDVLEKILRLNFKDDEYTCIANLVPFGKKQSENQKTALALAFNSAINDVYKQSLRSWKKIVQTYVLENTDFLLGLMPEIEFLVKATEFMRQILAANCALCIPEIVEEIDAETADQLMSDQQAYSTVVYEEETDPDGYKMIINLGVINQHFDKGVTVTLDSLKEKKLVPQKTKRLKVLAFGILNKPLTIKANSYSVQAIKMIELTGGTVVIRRTKQ